MGRFGDFNDLFNADIDVFVHDAGANINAVCVQLHRYDDDDEVLDGMDLGAILVLMSKAKMSIKCQWPDAMLERSIGCRVILLKIS